MPVAQAHFHEAEDALAAPPKHRKRGLARLLPEHAMQPALRDWAHAVAAAAERRVAELEARIAHLESQVTTDELTGLLNRRGFLEAFARANAAAQRGGPTGVVMLCDLDGFKQVNDVFGHAEGDDILRRAASVLSRQTRKMDAVGRLGGDEFALLLISAPVAIVARKITCLADALDAAGIRASFGAAGFDGTDDEAAVLHRADMAMYENKRRHAAAVRLTPGG